MALAAGFLLNVPLKTSYEVSLAEPLKAAFKEGGYSKDSVTGSIEEFQKFRSQVIAKNLPKTHATLEMLYRYHDQLKSLTQRLPNLSHKALPSNPIIYWDDSLDKGGLFGGKANISTSSLELERLCVLFNIAAFQSHLAAECRSADSDEELKNAAKLFQSAATIFNSLAETKNPVLEGVTLTSDLKPETLAALSSLMLAQAQEVFVDKAIKDKMKDSIIAKLCVQTEDMFNDASTMLSKDTLKHIWDRAWLSNVSAKKIAYGALVQYFQSQVCATKKLYGEQIGRLNVCIKNVKKAQEKIGSSTYLSDIMTEAERLHKEAKRDNDFIYHEVIPNVDDLTPTDKVGSARLAKLGTVPESFSDSFHDMFESAVHKHGDGADGASSIKEIFNTAASSLGQYLVNNFKSPKK